MSKISNIRKKHDTYDWRKLYSWMNFNNPLSLLYFSLLSIIMVPIILIVFILFAPSFWFQRPIWFILYISIVLFPKCFLFPLFYETPHTISLFHWIILLCPFLLYWESSTMTRVILSCMIVADIGLWMKYFRIYI
uniref:Uncharacterized protein n=1 Tax=viral metagenome TaxID=1070528 RepID=A0A6C0CZF1_9ZZZZ